MAHAYDSTISGLPAVYSCYEAKVLIDQGVAELVSTPETVPEEIQEEYKDFLNSQLKGQQNQLHNKSISSIPTDELPWQVSTDCPFRVTTHCQSIESSNQIDLQKYAVFLDLWKRNFFITNGHTFGGDFLIYPQDPIVCHASHVVHILKTGQVAIRDFVTVNRLCVGVKKDCLFAYQTPDNPDEINYQTSSWDSSWDK